MVTLSRLMSKLYCGRARRIGVYRTLIFVGFFLGVPQVWSWNATGHRLSAQIAYDNLTPHAKERFNAYNHALDKVYEPLSFVNASTWLDTLRSEGINWYTSYHYIDIYYSTESQTLPTPQLINGVWALREAVHILENPKINGFDKGISFRIILHVVGDLHQPMHTASRVSAKFPEGDIGGNLVELGKNSVANNLHAYWDQGGGAFRTHNYSSAGILKRARAIENQYPCKRSNSNFMNWVDESHAMAVNIAYNVKAGEVPSEKYQRIVRKLSEQRIAQAGCRIATLLNKIDKKLSDRTDG